MRDLVATGVGFVALAVVLFIGVGLVVLTSNTVTTVAGNSTLLTSVGTNIDTVFTTFTGLLPVLALAVIGGLALAYVLGFITPRGG